MRIKQLPPEQQEAEKKRQVWVFEELAKLAKEQKIPLLVHTRWAEKRVIDVLDKVKPAKVIMHAFYPDAKQLEWIKKNRYYCSAGPAILKNQEAATRIAGVPAELLLTETDCPYQVTSPKEVKKVVDKLSEIRGKPMEKQVEKNLLRIFEDGLKSFS